MRPQEDSKDNTDLRKGTAKIRNNQRIETIHRDIVDHDWHQAPMQTKHDEYLPECTDENTCDNRTDIVDAHSCSADKLTSPGSNWSNDQERQRDHNQEREERGKEILQHRRHDSGNAALNFRTKPQRYNDWNNAGCIIHENDRKSQELHMDCRAENGALKHRIQRIAFHDCSYARIDQRCTDSHSGEFVHLELAGCRKTKENRQEIEEHIPEDIQHLCRAALWIDNRSRRQKSRKAFDHARRNQDTQYRRENA